MKNIYKLITVIIFTFLSVGSVFAADITADELVYDSQSKTVSATGNVVINDGESTITGASGKYDFNDKTAILSGGVNYTKNQDTLSCETLYIYSDKTINGKGNVELDFKSENIFLSGDEISYNQNTGIGQINGNGYFKSQDGIIRAPQIEGHLKDVLITASGGVEITAYTQNVHATGNELIYTKSGTYGTDGKLVLKGNAVATQNGNRFEGPELIFKEEEKVIETNGRSTMTINL